MGLFRQDLYYRISITSIHIPPLREHREDIPLLANHFLQTKCLVDFTELSELVVKSTKRGPGV